MRKTFLFIFLLFIIILKISCSVVKLGSGKSFEERLKEEDLESYEADHSMENKMKELIQEYVQDQEWSPDKQLEKEVFKKMFVNLIQRGALRTGNSEILKRLADKILEKHGEPIIVKNLEKYFNIEELTLTYSKLLTPNSDL